MKREVLARELGNRASGEGRTESMWQFLLVQQDGGFDYLSESR